MSGTVGSVYRGVIDEVIKNMKTDFVAEGVEDKVLAELQQIWESKLAQSGTTGGFIPDAVQGVPDYHGYGAPSYDAPGTYPGQFQLPDHNFPNMQLPPDPHIYPVPAFPHSSDHTTATARALQNLQNLHNPTPSFDPSVGRPAPFLQHPAIPAPWAQDQHLATQPRPVPPPARVPSGTLPGLSVRSLVNDPLIPQHDGAGDEDDGDVVLGLAVPSDSRQLETKKVDDYISQRIDANNRSIPQLDGNSDDEDDDDDDEANKAGDEELGSDLDDDDEDAEPETEHLVLCQFEKVTRVKNKRKCNLKDGIMHLNGRDTLFHKATGEFDW
eukprot:TRINITY_DN5262_c0_g1_i1.p1 TRINITY_DN5262_c0_g1~~TRINITY_DN5262_c0_g1_i1.p1  ORF type:complete len:326 (-),score=86.92 TRINITY_DN5262_c0_g1_i1:35-1012(-)